MHVPFVLPQLLTPISLSIVAGICARSHHQASAADDTFAIPPFVGYLMLGCGAFFCFVPFLPRAAGDMSATRFLFIMTPAWGGAFAAAIYFFRYRVVVTDATLTVGAFRKRVIPFEDVIDYDVISGSRSAELVVYLRDGTKLKLSGLLPDFDELVGMINSHMATPANGQFDSPAELLDRAARAQAARHVGWIMAVGLVLVAVAVYVTSRLGY